jgi:hypothetical protein
MGEPFAPQKRASPIVIIILLITFLLSLFSIFLGLDYYVRGDLDPGSTYIILGTTTLALSSYVLFQMRRKLLRLALKAQPITTTIVCEKCGLKNVRDFKRGDYIFKEVEACPKCNEKMVITSIYREVPKKKREETKLG